MLIHRRLASTLVLGAIAVALAAGLAHAGSPLGIGTAEPAFQTTGLFGGFLAWVNDNQKAFYRALTGALKAMRDDPANLWGLIGLSFAYGVFHAAGPGHGKAVISSYMIANETELKRGVVISFVSAMLQGIVAIVLVAVAYLILRGSSVKLSDATDAMEIASYSLIIAFGLWLLFRKLRSLFLASRAPASAALFAGATAAPGRAGTTGLSFSASAVEHGHDGLTPGSFCPDCGITHLPDPRLLGSRDFSLREAWSAIVAVGLRPCSGALLVMTFALLNGLYLGGILSVFAMAIGTAITVSVLATIAVSAKDLALRLAGPGTARSNRISSAIEILGAALVIALGVILLLATLQP